MKSDGKHQRRAEIPVLKIFCFGIESPAGSVCVRRMSKVVVQSGSHTSLLERRRRVRRLRMIVDVTTSLIQYDDSLTHREARCLVECARKAIEELFPELSSHLRASLVPRLERAVRSRWPLEEAAAPVPAQSQELVN